MKKTLWTLSAIALIGLGAYACGDDDCDPSECAAGQECISDILGGSQCGWPCGEDCAAKSQECVRSINECKNPCDLNQTRDPKTGLCISDTLRDECTTKAECEENQDCINGVCTDMDEPGVEKVYKYVRIDDLTDTSKETKLEDPGADIDTIILLKGGTGSPIYPSEVVYYQRADGKKAKEKGVACDPDIVKTLTSFTKYPDTSECTYRKSDGEYTFASLGGTDAKGNVGTLIVEMGGTIEAGDKIDVLELGDCKLADVNQTNPAAADPVKVSISVGSELDDTWQVIKDSGKASKGVISISITADMVPAPAAE